MVIRSIDEKSRFSLKLIPKSFPHLGCRIIATTLTAGSSQHSTWEGTWVTKSTNTRELQQLNLILENANSKLVATNTKLVREIAERERA
jgi:hypothetical protein